jgi:peptide/nickel transport system permease protein
MLAWHGQVLSVRERDYVMAARTMGASDRRIMLLHILPNVTAPLIVQASLGIAGAILTEAGLSFLGLGVQPPTPSWGSMLNAGRGYLEIDPWLMFAQAWPFSYGPRLQFSAMPSATCSIPVEEF